MILNYVTIGGASRMPSAGNRVPSGPLIGAAVPARQFVYYANQRIQAAVSVGSRLAQLLDAGLVSSPNCRLPLHSMCGGCGAFADFLRG